MSFWAYCCAQILCKQLIFKVVNRNQQRIIFFFLNILYRIFKKKPELNFRGRAPRASPWDILEDDYREFHGTVLPFEIIKSDDIFGRGAGTSTPG